MNDFLERGKGEFKEWITGRPDDLDPIKNSSIKIEIRRKASAPVWNCCRLTDSMINFYGAWVRLKVTWIDGLERGHGCIDYIHGYTMFTDLGTVSFIP